MTQNLAIPSDSDFALLCRSARFFFRQPNYWFTILMSRAHENLRHCVRVSQFVRLIPTTSISNLSFACGFCKYCTFLQFCHVLSVWFHVRWKWHPRWSVCSSPLNFTQLSWVTCTCLCWEKGVTVWVISLRQSSVSKRLVCSSVFPSICDLGCSKKFCFGYRALPLLNDYYLTSKYITIWKEASNLEECCSKKDKTTIIR